MERCQPQDFVLQLPRRNVEEVVYRDAVEDKQVLLNESWAQYCQRKGYAAERHGEEHEKWVTETWAEYEQRVIFRHSALSKYFDERKRDEEAAIAKANETALHSKSMINHLLAAEAAYRSTKMAPIHTLYVDFDERQQRKMQMERDEVESLENAGRAVIDSEEQNLRSQLEALAAQSMQDVLDALEARRRAKEEEERRFLEEQRRKAEEMRQIEETRRREAEAADKARREAEEEAKRAERKRREEERKNKAKAEREARAKQTRTEQDTSVENVEPEKKQESAEVKADDVPPQPPAQPLAPKYPSLPAANSLSALLSSVTNCLRLKDEDVYIIRATATTALVVAQNGSVIGATRGTGKNNLVGLSLSEPTCISIGSQRIRAKCPADVKSYIANRVEFVPNVETDTRCFTFTKAAKSQETLLLVPANLESSSLQYIVAVCRSGVGSIDSATIEAVTAYVLEQFSIQLRALLQRQKVSILAKQALDWLSITTCCKNCYLSMVTDNFKVPNELQYVAASDTQKFMIGKTHTRADESSGLGVSFALIDESLKTGQPEVAHISDVLDKQTNKVNSNDVRTFGDKKKGSLLLCPVIRPTHPNSGSVFGVLYADTIDDDKVFNKADEDILRTTAVLLAELLEPNNEGLQQPTALKLAIEKDLGGSDGESPIEFLKHVWLRVNTDISKITSGQLLELSKYSHPPPIIPITITATLLVALGSNPKAVENWEDSRKKIKTSLVEKIVAFDPTDSTKRKKAFFTRSKKITKGFSAHDVFTRGSYPASCFFTWTFVTILLRKSADALRKALKQVGIEGIPVELLDAAAEDEEPEVMTEGTDDVDDTTKGQEDED